MANEEEASSDVFEINDYTNVSPWEMWVFTTLSATLTLSGHEAYKSVSTHFTYAHNNNINIG